VITVVDKDIIRRLHLVQGWSERRIARELGFARETVRKYLREESDTVPRYRLTKPRAKPVMAAVLPLIRQWLADDLQQPRKQRRTAHQIWRQLWDEHGFRGAEPTVRRAVRELKGEQRPVFVPLAFDPGEQAEVDWGTAQVILAGVVTTAHLFCARLRYSGMPFVMAFPHEQQEAFFTQGVPGPSPGLRALGRRAQTSGLRQSEYRCAASAGRARARRAGGLRLPAHALPL
jgi:transposase